MCVWKGGGGGLLFAERATNHLRDYNIKVMKLPGRVASYNLIAVLFPAGISSPN